MQIVLKTGLCGLLILLNCGLLAAGDKEQDELPATGLLRETGHVEGYMTLPMGESDIAATYVADKLGEAYGKVMILHDADGGIDSHGLVHTLRLSLAESGWSTMTIALDFPVAPRIYLSATEASAAMPTVAASEAASTNTDTEADNKEIPAEESEVPHQTNSARIGTALAYLNAQQPGPTVVVALGASASLVDTVSSQLGEQRGLVWIQPEPSLTEVPGVVPILDIAAQRAGSVNKEARARRALMRQHQVAGYSQRLITGAGHGFYGFEGTVLAYVRGWLSKHFVSETES